MAEQDPRVNEQRHLAAALRRLAGEAFAEAGRLSLVPRQGRAAKREAARAVTIREIAGLIEEGKFYL